MEKACVHIYCGNGKGKTTASIGLLVRAAGAGENCLLTQFLKTSKTSELNSLEKLGIGVLRSESKLHKFVFHMNEEEKAQYAAEQQELFGRVREAVLSQKYDLVVMDEVLDAVSMKMITEEELDELICAKGKTELVLTGRCPGEQTAELADYYSRIDPVKHPYQQGIAARKGIEF